MHNMDKNNYLLDQISVFFPFYNEENNIEPITEKATKIFNTLAKKYEIILINDGSTDNTHKNGLHLAHKYKTVRLLDQENLGYGGAINRGMQEARYNWVFFSDGDMQFDLAEVKKLLKFTKSYRVIIGYRQYRSEGILRYAISQLLRYWNKIFFNFPMYIKDIDCAFKLIHKDIIKEIAPLEIDGAMVSTEMLLKITYLGEFIKQVPVAHYKRIHGKASGADINVILKAVKETFKLRKLYNQWTFSRNS